MKFAIFTLVLTVLAASASAVVLPLKSVIISFPDATPSKVVSEAIHAVKTAGGMITHEYKLIKGFAARVNAKGITAIQTMKEFPAIIEEDATVHAIGPA